jgi:hypothetical protein
MQLAMNILACTFLPDVPGRAVMLAAGAVSAETVS